MKTRIIILLLLTTTTSLFAQKDKLKIEAAVTSFFNGLSLIDADTLKHYSTADFHLLENGEIWTIDTLINKMALRKNIAFKRINNIDFIRIEQIGKTAWVSYKNTADITIGGNQQFVKWLESAVLLKRKGRWRIQLLHATKLK